MMKQILSLLLIIPFFAISQINQFDSNKKKHGVWVKNYENSHVNRYKGKFNHGVPVDTFVYRYQSGAVSAIMIFSKKGTFSRAKMYHETGYLMAKGNYINKEKDSMWVYFDSRGKVSYTEEFKKGKLDGQKVVYYERDKNTNKILPAQVITYKNGILDGPVKEYFPGGKIKSEATYRNDKYEGLQKKYHPNGKLAVAVRWKNGVKHGWTLVYNEAGAQTNKRYFYRGTELKGKKLEKKMADLKASGKNPNEW